MLAPILVTWEPSYEIRSPSSVNSLHFSLARSAKLHDLGPYQYYVEIMKAIPYCEKAEDYEALLPWNIDLVKVTTKNQ